MYFTTTEGQPANIFTGISITLTLFLVFIAFQIKITAMQSLYFIVGGLVLYAAANFTGKTLLTSVLKRKIWAFFLTIILMVLVTISISIYMTGIVILIVKGIESIWSVIF